MDEQFEIALMAASAAALCTTVSTPSLVADHEPRECGACLSRRPRKRITDPCQRDHISGIHASGHEHHGEIPWPSCGGCSSNDEREDGEVEGDGDVPISLARAISMPGIEEGGNDGEGVWGHCEKEGDDVRVPQCLNHGGKEIGHGARSDKAE